MYLRSRTVTSKNETLTVSVPNDKSDASKKPTSQESVEKGRKRKNEENGGSGTPARKKARNGEESEKKVANYDLPSETLDKWRMKSGDFSSAESEIDQLKDVSLLEEGEIQDVPDESGESVVFIEEWTASKARRSGRKTRSSHRRQDSSVIFIGETTAAKKESKPKPFNRTPKTSEASAKPAPAAELQISVPNTESNRANSSTATKIKPLEEASTSTKSPSTSTKTGTEPGTSSRPVDESSSKVQKADFTSAWKPGTSPVTVQAISKTGSTASGGRPTYYKDQQSKLAVLYSTASSVNKCPLLPNPQDHVQVSNATSNTSKVTNTNGTSGLNTDRPHQAAGFSGFVATSQPSARPANSSGNRGAYLNGFRPPATGVTSGATYPTFRPPPPPFPMYRFPPPPTNFQQPPPPGSSHNGQLLFHSKPAPPMRKAEKRWPAKKKNRWDQRQQTAAASKSNGSSQAGVGNMKEQLNAGKFIRPGYDYRPLAPTSWPTFPPIPLYLVPPLVRPPLPPPLPLRPKDQRPNLPYADSGNATGRLREIVIDGSNVAMDYGRRVFDSRGILLCARYFLRLGHKIRVFVPQFREREGTDGGTRRRTVNRDLLIWMQERDLLTFTPHRVMERDDNGNRCQRAVTCYDDYFIVEYAHTTGGVIVSKDNYRDVIEKFPEWARTVNHRLLMYTWVGDMFMPARDPLGKNGPPLESFLRHERQEGDGSSLSSIDDRLLHQIDELLDGRPKEKDKKKKKK